MSAYISVPRDLTQVKPKVALNLTTRQLICFSIAAAIGVPSFFLIKHFAGTTAATGSMIIIMLPMFFLAMYERNGQFLETILRHYIEARLIRPKVRPYKTDNYYSALMREMKA
ncbi:MAG: PrgI family protein, partial [Lachnospiraceae bacterium]|nr:PrgI family protein [Lachnospiraceae bacterium]